MPKASTVNKHHPRRPEDYSTDRKMALGIADVVREWKESEAVFTRLAIAMAGKTKPKKPRQRPTKRYE